MQWVVGTLLAVAQKQHFSATDNLRYVFLHQLWFSKVLCIEGNVEKNNQRSVKSPLYF